MAGKGAWSGVNNKMKLICDNMGTTCVLKILNFMKEQNILELILVLQETYKERLISLEHTRTKDCTICS